MSYAHKLSNPTCRVRQLPRGPRAAATLLHRRPLPRALSAAVSQARAGRSTPPRSRGSLSQSSPTTRLAAAPAAAAVDGAAGDEAEEGDPAPGSSSSSVLRNSLRALEWPAVCRQVACFCGTPMAAERILSAGLPIGRSRVESEALVAQTAQALDAQLVFDGVYDIRPALDATEAGYGLNAKQLEGVATTMECAFALRRIATTPTAADDPAAAAAATSTLKYPHLAELAAAIDEREAATLDAIRKCVRSGSLADDASETLLRVRRKRRDNLQALRTAADDWSRDIVAKGMADSRNVMVIRGRFCVAVKAGRQSELPKGSVRLGSSTSGASVYMEPAPLVVMNNDETLLGEQEEAEEATLLALLSRVLGTRAAPLRGMLEAVTQLDVVAARAAHAKWLGATRPAFVDVSHHLQQQQQLSSASSASSPSTTPPPPPAPLVSLPWAAHPLLLEPSLPPLPLPPSLEDRTFDRDFTEAPAWERPGGASSSSSGKGRRGASAAGARPAPVPLELLVPAGKRVVAITGPNTGGKTVALKTAGLLCLMAKAGLYLPVNKPRPALATTAEEGAAQSGAAAAQPAEPAASHHHHHHHQQQAPAPASSAAAAAPAPAAAATASPQVCRVGWFDAVLADIGDSQSLQQNLSTFSGHVSRIQGILAAATPSSLVLLDEVGSGTDPVEGSALARALLDRLATSAALTLATTHHAELKTASDEDDRYVNVSMEFDGASLRPTYRLCWGSAGASNALSIAQALGFDGGVVAEARRIVEASARREAQAAAESASHLEAVAAALSQQLEEARRQLRSAEAKRLRKEAELDVLKGLSRQLKEFGRRLEGSPRAVLEERNVHRRRIAKALDEASAGRPGGLEAVDSELASLEALIPDRVAKYLGRSFVKEGDPVVGDEVYVPSLGGLGRGVVRKVAGDHVRVEALGSQLAGFIGSGRGAGKLLRLRKSEVRVLPKAPAAPAWAAVSEEQAQREADYRRLVADVDSALSSPQAAAAAAAQSQTDSSIAAADFDGAASDADEPE